ncbi:altronate dehydratase family protein [Schnuerera sp. xch1]|uniref:UxaA family hydrolase n=1 Tax=Schnuerera sp. xch1 TaxID=2874283 RepID=UPI001CBC1D32|nr:altronate dehydratase family protein [Schnuerera sp. xch1]MBZ2174055.1 altronate dehydratase family protein [Schnuerera sp. xch1]
MKKFLKINEIDNTIVSLKDLKKGMVLQDGDQSIQLLEDIKPGHKIAIQDIKAGEDIIKYGFPIGQAKENILKGQWVHTHNTRTNLGGTIDYKYNPKFVDIPKRNGPTTFMGYRRKNGDVGIRNELLIVPTVGCINGIAEMIADTFIKELNPKDINDIRVYKHNYGCSQLGDDFENTRRILIDIVKHPNVGGVLVIGLGCENNIIEEFIERMGEYDKERIKFLKTQTVKDEVEDGVILLKEIYETMKDDKREEVPISELKVGLKCGGSDGFSGITANPLLGEFSDYLINHGGTTILTEVPEMFGAETILMDRAESKEVFKKIVSLINNFKEYFISHNQPIYENPSPGNKEGGITTLEDKSLGCTQKGGKSIVVDVLEYGDFVTKNGLNLLNSPGNDLVSTTALAASGCQMVLFTTGRGTPYGSFVPTVKVSTNTVLYKLKPHWIDFNAGVLLEDMSMDDLLDDFIKYIIDVANGKYTNNEKKGFKEIAILKTGVTL